MEKFANAMFYLLTLLAFASSLFVLVSRETRVYLVSAVIAFISIGGLYTLLKSPVMFVAQIVFFALGTGAIILWGGLDFKPEKKPAYSLNIKTMLSCAFLCLFVLMISPFLVRQLNTQKLNDFNCAQSIGHIANILDVNLIIISIALIALLSGFYTIAFWRKK